MNHIFFLPAPIRAYLYCKRHDFSNFIEGDINLSLAKYDWLGKNWPYESGKERPPESKQNEWMLKRKLGISSFLLIRRNSEVEQHFLSIENMYYMERS